MKPLARTLIVAMIGLTLMTRAVADGDGYPNHRGNRHGQASQGSDSAAPLALLGIAGAILATSAPSSDTPQSGYSAMPRHAPSPAFGLAPPAQPADAAYWCGSVGQYYPNTQYCPEGWQMVPRR